MKGPPENVPTMEWTVLLHQEFLDTSPKARGRRMSRGGRSPHEPPSRVRTKKMGWASPVGGGASIKKEMPTDVGAQEVRLSG